MEAKNLSRRNMLKLSAVAAGGLALAGLAGCASNETESENITDVQIPESGILPLGSVVQLKSFEGTDIKHVIVARRPLVSSGHGYNDDGTWFDGATSKIYDYGVTIWPISFYSDLAQHNRDYETMLIDAKHISSVIFVGYIDDQETQAGQAIANAETDKDINDILGDQMQDLFKAANETLGSE